MLSASLLISVGHGSPRHDQRAMAVLSLLRTVRGLDGSRRVYRVAAEGFAAAREDEVSRVIRERAPTDRVSDRYCGLSTFHRVRQRFLHMLRCCMKGASAVPPHPPRTHPHANDHQHHNRNAPPPRSHGCINTAAHVIVLVGNDDVHASQVVLLRQAQIILERRLCANDKRYRRLAPMSHVRSEELERDGEQRGAGDQRGQRARCW